MEKSIELPHISVMILPPGILLPHRSISGIQVVVIDLHTLMISLLIVVVLLALLMLLTAKVQKNYPGFNIWSISLIALIISTVFLISRGTIPDYISILPGNFFLLISLLLMSESLHRFFTNSPLNRMYYVILVPVTILIGYYTLVEDNISIRSLIISLASIFIIIITIRLIIRKSPKGNIPSLIL